MILLTQSKSLGGKFHCGDALFADTCMLRSDTNNLCRITCISKFRL